MISSCVINLSGDKDRVLSQAFRMLKPGGVLEESEYCEKLPRSGFEDVDVEVTRTHSVEYARSFLSAEGIDVDAVVDQVEGRFVSGFLWGRMSMYMRSAFKTICLLSILGTLAAFGRQAATTDEEAAILKQLKGLRGVPDDQRGGVTKRIALDIRKLPPDAAKMRLANGLAGLSTEGDFGHDTLQEVATTLAEAIRQQPAQPAETYLELAQLVRYEHVHIKLDNAQLTAAVATLVANDHDRQQADFTLQDLNGKAWTLKNLRDHVVIVNFWATWCPPCRKEMPDLDALYKQYKDQGLVVLAISDEEPGKITQFLASHGVSYPILVDPDRKVNDKFHVDGIPKSFIYDRQGNLAAQSIDMRTRSQFIELLTRAGLATGAGAP